MRIHFLLRQVTKTFLLLYDYFIIAQAIMSLCSLKVFLINRILASDQNEDKKGQYENPQYIPHAKDYGLRSNSLSRQLR